jgi:hypothetical protein
MKILQLILVLVVVVVQVQCMVWTTAHLAAFGS